MTYRVRQTVRADEDIERNARWWAEHHSERQAIKWFFAIQEQLKTLSQMLERYPLSLENPRFEYRKNSIPIIGRVGLRIPMYKRSGIQTHRGNLKQRISQSPGVTVAP